MIHEYIDKVGLINIISYSEKDTVKEKRRWACLHDKTRGNKCC